MQTEYDAKSFADLDTYRRIIGILVKNYDERVKYQGRFDEEDFVLDEIRVIIINYLINPEYGCKKRDLNAQMLASSLQESPYYKFDDTIGEYINQEESQINLVRNFILKIKNFIPIVPILMKSYMQKIFMK